VITHLVVKKRKKKRKLDPAHVVAEAVSHGENRIT